MKPTKNDQSHDTLSLLDVIKSVAAAMFGVQSESNRERDFSKGKASHFIITGIVFVLVLLLIVANLVASVIENGP